MHWLDRQEAKVNLSVALVAAGWQRYGFTEDRSDMMTDYYAPAHWDGVATKDGFVLCVDVYSDAYSGGRSVTIQEDFGECKRCKGSGADPQGWTYQQAKVDPDAFNRHHIELEHGPDSGIMCLSRGILSPVHFVDYGPEKCVKCHGTGRIRGPVAGFDPWPEFHKTPKGSTWHLERDGTILAKGVGLAKFVCSPYERDPEKLAALKANTDALIAKVEGVMRKANKGKSAKPTTPRQEAPEPSDRPTMATPDAPATSRQLWALHRILKRDTRGWNLTKVQASNLIDQAKRGEDISGQLPA